MNGIAIFVLAGLFLAFIFFGPLVSIWALNTLFGLHIGFGLTQWIAAFWLQLMMAAKLSLKFKK